MLYADLFTEKTEEHVPPRKRKRIKPDPPPVTATLPVLIPPGPTVTIPNPYHLFRDLRTQVSPVSSHPDIKMPRHE